MQLMGSTQWQKLMSRDDLYHSIEIVNRCSWYCCRCSWNRSDAY